MGEGNPGPKAEAWRQLKTVRLADDLERAATQAVWTKGAIQKVMPAVNSKSLQAFIRGDWQGLTGTASLTHYLQEELVIGSVGKVDGKRLECEVIVGKKIYYQPGVVPPVSFMPRAYRKGRGSAY